MKKHPKKANKRREVHKKIKVAVATFIKMDHYNTY